MILLAPHPDDEALFCSYLIQRLHPLVIVCTDGTTHEKFGVTWRQRRQESIQSAKILGCDIHFLGIPENELMYEVLKDKLSDFNSDTWCCPAKQGGHKHHDLVYDVVKNSKQSFLSYATYTNDSLKLEGQNELCPNKQEVIIKNNALDCFKSQIKINPHHFSAVRNKSEFFNIEIC